MRLRPGARYLTSRELVLPPGQKAFDGEGALIAAHVGIPKGDDAANVFRFKAQSKGIIRTEVRIDLKGSAARTRTVLAPRATDCFIARNVATTNTRNLSIQDGSSGNHMRSNDFSDSVSAAIHVAYGSSDNLVEHNRIRTGRGKGGEALLQAYHNSTDNVFRHNRVEVHGERVPRWFLYVATGSHNTVFHGNTLIGEASHAVAAAESIWDQRSVTSAGLNPNPYSYLGSANRASEHQGGGALRGRPR